MFTTDETEAEIELLERKEKRKANKDWEIMWRVPLVKTTLDIRFFEICVEKFLGKCFFVFSFRTRNIARE
jgi:hypothetical protein